MREFKIIALLIFILLALKKGKQIFISREQQNENVLNSLHPVAKNGFRQFVERVEYETNYFVYLTSGFRDLTKQARLAQTSGGATAGFSFHNYGLAIDLNLIHKNTGKWIRKADEKNIWESTGVPKIAREIFHFRWGGDFNTPDRVHFDYGNFYSTSNLFQIAKNNPEIKLNELDLTYA